MISKEIKKKLLDLIDKELSFFNQLNYGYKIVPGSIPILWFGDVEKYFTSGSKIITVSLNPSNVEFENPNNAFPSPTTYRFPKYNGSIDSLYHSYNSYFNTRDHNPYGSWFKASFAHVLKSFEASHYDIEKNAALHTDIAIPYATDPTWSRLGLAEKQYLEPIGERIWLELVTLLEPDIILISASPGFHTKIKFKKIFDEWMKLIDQEKFPVLYNQVLINQKKVDVIFQTQGRKPFLNLSKEDKFNLRAKLEIVKNDIT